jgi:hypothetical protein
VHLDSDYDSGKTRDTLTDHGLHGEIARRGEKAPSQATHQPAASKCAACPTPATTPGRPHCQVSLGGGPPATRRASGVGRRLPAEQPVVADICQRILARGHDDPHAVRLFARAWVYVLWC